MSTCGRPVDSGVNGMDAGLIALEAGAAAARAAVCGLRHELERRGALVRKRVAERDEAVAERQQLARARLARPAMALADLEARAQQEESALEQLNEDLQQRCSEPWPSPDGHIGNAPSVNAFGTKVCLSIGGANFEACSQTLRAGSAWFGALLSSEFTIPRCEDGSIFIDRDPSHFQLMLDYLLLGLGAVRSRIAQLDVRDRREALEEAAFYHLHELAGALAVPCIGASVTAIIPEQELVDKSIHEPLRHHVCGGCHAPGCCALQPVACGLLGTAELPCVVSDYQHCAQRRTCGDGTQESVDHWATSVGEPRWKVEFRKHQFHVVARQLF